MIKKFLEWLFPKPKSYSSQEMTLAMVKKTIAQKKIQVEIIEIKKGTH